MHVNSIIAYREEMEKFNEREKLIYGHLTFKGPQTDREAKDELFGISADANKVRPRISDLMKKGWIREVGKKRCQLTGKKVRIVRAVTPEERIEGQQELF